MKNDIVYDRVRMVFTKGISLKFIVFNTNFGCYKFTIVFEDIFIVNVFTRFVILP